MKISFTPNYKILSNNKTQIVNIKKFFNTKTAAYLSATMLALVSYNSAAANISSSKTNIITNSKNNPNNPAPYAQSMHYLNLTREFTEQLNNKITAVFNFNRIQKMKELAGQKTPEFPSSEDSKFVDFGNCLIDKLALQKTGNCWAHASINALSKTVAGRIMLQSHIFKNPKNQNTVVHLQEAEDKGFHGGYYVFTKNDIYKAAKYLSSGDGDVTAYMLAIEMYLKESENRAGIASNYGILSRGFEIITGTKQYSSINLESKFRQPFAEFLYKKYRMNFVLALSQFDRIPYDVIMQAIDKGIYTKSDPKENDYDDVYKMIEKGNSAGILSIQNDNVDSKHAYSIVGVHDGKMLLQDSELDSVPKSLPVYSKDGRVITYIISREMVSQISQFSVLKF